MRADIQLGSIPSGGAAAATPIVRPPAYEGTEYADISQFGVPRPDPTYANVPKQEVVYSNVESMWALINTLQLLCEVWIVNALLHPDTLLHPKDSKNWTQVYFLELLN